MPPRRRDFPSGSLRAHSMWCTRLDEYRHSVFERNLQFVENHDVLPERTFSVTEAPGVGIAAADSLWRYRVEIRAAPAPLTDRGKSVKMARAEIFSVQVQAAGMTAQLRSLTQTAGSQANQSIIDGITVLQALATSEEPVGSRELARRLGLENTRVNRLLKTLASIGMAEQNVLRKYRPGPGMHVLAAQSLYASGLLRNAIISLEKLAYFNHTVALGVLWQNSVSFLYHGRPGMSASEGIGRIGLREATTSGIGMVLLAMQPEEQVARIYEGKDIPGYPKGLKSLLRELAAIRKKGYARVEVFPENAVRTPSHSIAVPVGNPATSAIAMSGWIPEAAVNELVEALQQARREIEAGLNRPKSSRRSA